MSNPYDPDNQGQPGDPYDPAGSSGGNPPPPPPYGSDQPPPYGGDQPSPFGGDQQPYGQQPPPPYGAPGAGGGGFGGTPYGQGPYGGEPMKKTDAVSITGFVLSFTCCLSIVGVILGFVGLRRTKQGQRKGRWAAIAAIVVGIIGTLIAAGAVVAIVFVAKNAVTPANATAGQCVDVTEADGSYSFFKKDCTESHEAEIVYVGQASDYDGDLAGAIDPVSLCTGLMAPGDVEKVGSYAGELRFNVIIEDPKNISPSDKFFCYVEPPTGTLSDPIL